MEFNATELAEIMLEILVFISVLCFCLAAQVAIRERNIKIKEQHYAEAMLQWERTLDEMADDIVRRRK